MHDFKQEASSIDDEMLKAWPHTRQNHTKFE